MHVKQKYMSTFPELPESEMDPLNTKWKKQRNKILVYV